MSGYDEKELGTENNETDTNESTVADSIEKPVEETKEETEENNETPIKEEKHGEEMNSTVSDSEETGENSEDYSAVEEPEANTEQKEDEHKGFVGGLPKPVKIGEELEVNIESVGAKGDGIAKKDGFVIFIAGVQKGETVKIRITDLKSSFAIGEKI